MGKWVVNIKETLIKTVEVEAENSQDALSKAQDAYHCEVIVLDYNDYVNTDFECVDKQDGWYMVDMKL